MPTTTKIPVFAIRQLRRPRAAFLLLLRSGQEEVLRAGQALPSRRQLHAQCAGQVHANHPGNSADTQAYKYIADNYDSAERRFHNAADQTEKKQEKQQYGSAAGFKNDKRQKTRMEQNEYEDFQEYDAYFKNSKKFRKPKVGEDIYLNISISLKESVSGVGKEVAYSRYEPCQQCTSKPYSACFSCGGKAEIYDRVNREKVRCEACSGKGFRNDCSGCLGAGYIVKEVKEKVYAEKGTQDKTILKMEYKGHSGYKADNGHLYVTILVEQDPLFRIDGNNVHSHLDLDFLTATFGGSIRVATLHG